MVARRLASTIVAGTVLAAGSVGAADVLIEMRAATYTPASVHGRVGDMLTFVNHDTVPHQPFVPTTGWGVNVGDVKSGDTARFPLPHPGQFEVECAYHPGMRTVVIVDR
jgi:plastocyanin